MLILVTASRLIGIALSSNPQTDGVLIKGLANFSIFNFSYGFPLYLSNTPGDFTATAPVGTGDIVRVMGYQVATNTIYFNPDNTWVTLA